MLTKITNRERNMKLLWLLPAFILILFVKISSEQFDNTMREQDARALFREAQQSNNTPLSYVTVS
jgi:hypothetical protein